MKMTKKSWSEPELIVLVRGKPEEGVLTNCKSEAIPEGGPYVGAGGCGKFGGGGCCVECSS